MRESAKDPGFTALTGHATGRKYRSVVVAEVIAIIGLTLSTVVAATAVSVGIARANAVGNIINHEGSRFAVALLLGFIFIGGLTAFTLPGHKPKKR